jgi:curved DNA-binding protein
MATKFRDYYEILGVPRKATKKEIDTAFRRLARKYHPDVNKDPAAIEKFKEINEAHEVLADPEKRKKYDHLGPDWDQAVQPGAAYSPGGSQVEYRTVSPEEFEDLFGDSRAPFSDFFYSVFGGGSPFSGQRGSRRGSRQRVAPHRGEDVEGELTISLEDAYAGITRTVELTSSNGTRRVEVRIPAGIHESAKVRAAGQGGTGQGGAAAGDLYMRIRIQPHSTFTRQGDDLQIRIPIPLRTALLGGTVYVPTLSGKRVELTIPAETQNGQRLRLRGLGMPHLRGSGKGDLYAEVDVRLPERLTDEQKRLIAQL